MMKSMTAFARASHKTAQATLTWEIRSVNHRFCELSVRLPESLRFLDTACRSAVKSHLERGKIEAQLILAPSEDANVSLNINDKLLSALVAAANQVDAAVGRESSLNALQLLRWPDMVQSEPMDEKALEEAAMSLLEETLERLNAARAKEGETLVRLLTERLDAIDAQLVVLKDHIPSINQGLRQRILDRFEALSIEVDPQRLEQELVYLAQKLDVQEEVDRLVGHVAEVRRIIEAGGVCGRRLDFLMQELNREANTLTSKSTDQVATTCAVEMKVLIEQIREQVQNIE